MKLFKKNKGKMVKIIKKKLQSVDIFLKTVQSDRIRLSSKILIIYLENCVLIESKD